MLQLIISLQFLSLSNSMAEHYAFVRSLHDPWVDMDPAVKALRHAAYACSVPPAAWRHQARSL